MGGQLKHLGFLITSRFDLLKENALNAINENRQQYIDITYSEERKDHDLAIKRQSNFPNRI